MIEIPNRSKYEVVRDYLLKELRSGKYPAGSRFTSENQLTQELGISKNTVREAISSLVSDGMIARVRGSGTFVREVPGESRVRQATLIVHNPHLQGAQDVFIGSLLAGLHTELDGKGWQIRLRMFTDSESRPAEAVAGFMRECGPEESVLLAGFDFTRDITDALAAGGYRFMTIGRPEDPAVPFVHTDHDRGVRAALGHLFALGHRRVALVDRRTAHRVSYEERNESYLRAVGDAGLVPDARLMVTYEGFDASRGEAAAELLLSRGVPFTAAVVYGDWPTYGFRRGLEKNGRAVPEDVSVICYGQLMGDMTSVNVCSAEMARRAARMLADPGAAPGGGVLVDPELVTGASTARAPEEARSARG